MNCWMYSAAPAEPIAFLIVPIAMAPKKRPAAAAASSKFPTVVSHAIKANPVLMPGVEAANLEACHLVPVKHMIDWMPKLLEHFGQKEQFWIDGDKSYDNGVALKGELHQHFDVYKTLAFLPNLDKKDAKDIKKNGADQLLVLCGNATTEKKTLPDVTQLLLTTSITSIAKTGKGFTVEFDSCIRVLINQNVPQTFLRVKGFFNGKEKDNAETLVEKMSNVKDVLEQYLKEKLLYFKAVYAAKKAKSLCNKILEHLEKPKCKVRIKYVVEGLPFYTVRGLQARSLRILQHPAFKGLHNGSRHRDDFSDSSGVSQKSPPDADEQEALLLRACRDSGMLARCHQDMLPPQKRARCWDFSSTAKNGKGLKA